MLIYLTADWIFPVCTDAIKNGVLAVQPNGKIEAVYTPEEAEALKLKAVYHSGVFVPGFINTHCHLELSHLKSVIPQHSGLVSFVQNIIKNRAADSREVLAAMQQADLSMYQNGIVAVGDIANQVESKLVKLKSALYYHTFIEAMGFNPAKAAQIIHQAKQLKADFEPLSASIVPHAPYSVSADLFKLIHQNALETAGLLSIHNQETSAENQFFENKSGDFLKLYAFLGLDIDFFIPSGKTALQTWLPWLKPHKMLLVHNTVTSKADIDFAKASGIDLYWCLCPQANLYIENKLPDVHLLQKEKLNITLGTDSLASNHQLNILAEMQILQQKKGIDFNELLRWGCINGAKFLNLETTLGTFEAGKTPGINLIQLDDAFVIKSDRVKKIL